MDARTYTHRDLARLLGVSETTVKSYRTKFPTFLPVARAGKPLRLHAEALSVCARIRDLFASGLSIGHVAQKLRSEFKEYPLNRRLSTAKSALSEATAEKTGANRLGPELQTLAAAQEASLRRIELLETEMRNLATLEAASKSLVAELIAELRAARAAADAHSPEYAAPANPQPEFEASRPEPEATARRIAAPEPPASGVAPKPSSSARQGAAGASPREGVSNPEGAVNPEGGEVLTARKIVTVHGHGGSAVSYALNREPRPASPFAAPARPEAAFLDLPAVILSERGEFLGLPGGQSVRRLVEALAAGEKPEWFVEGENAWACVLPLGRAGRRELIFRQMDTPRGNLVGLIRSMRLNEVEATPAQLQDMFRRLRGQMA